MCCLHELLLYKRFNDPVRTVVERKYNTYSYTTSKTDDFLMRQTYIQFTGLNLDIDCVIRFYSHYFFACSAIVELIGES